MVKNTFELSMKPLSKEMPICLYRTPVAVDHLDPAPNSHDPSWDSLRDPPISNPLGSLCDSGHQASSLESTYS